MNGEIDKLYSQFETDIKSNPNKSRELLMKLQAADHYVQMKFIENYEQGYCARFVIPSKDVISTIDIFPSLTVDKISQATIIDWQVPANARMHVDTYYNTLAFYIYHAARTNNEQLGKIALNLLLYKIWNGRLYKLIKWCNPEIMAAGITQYLDNRSIARKFPTPLEAIQKHFAPTLFTKYKPYLVKSSKETKRVFEQCYARVHQMFGSNAKIDLATGETRYQTGLQPSYYKAHKTQNKIVNTSRSNSTTSELDDRFVSSEIDSNIDNVVTFIILSTKPKYSDKFINFVVENIKGLKAITVPTILSKMHNTKYNDTLREIVELFFKRLRGIQSSEICSDKIYELTKLKIISSKNTQDVIYLKTLIDQLIDSIMKNDLEKPHNGYMNLTENQKAQYRSIIFYGISYNIQRTICQQ